MRKFTKLHRDINGATAVEYCLIAALIALTAITSMQGTGGSLKTAFNSTSSPVAGTSA